MCYLWELWLLVNQGHYVQLLDANEVEGVLVVNELNVLPRDALEVVLLLLELEDVPDKKLLQVLVGVVDAELLKAGNAAKKTSLSASTFIPCQIV